MASNYRLYRLDGAGKITRGEWIAGETDEEAIRAAEALATEGSYELWDRRRLVSRIAKAP